MKSRSVSVTGATGFLGWHIATELAARGWMVRAIVRPGAAKALPEGVEMAMPGDNVSLTIELVQPIAMEDGLRFAIREGGHTVGAGVVASIVE